MKPEAPIFNTRERRRIATRRRVIGQALRLAVASVLVAPTLVTPGETVFRWVADQISNTAFTLQAQTPEK